MNPVSPMRCVRLCFSRTLPSGSTCHGLSTWSDMRLEYRSGAVRRVFSAQPWIFIVSKQCFLSLWASHSRTVSLQSLEILDQYWLSQSQHAKNCGRNAYHGTMSLEEVLFCYYVFESSGFPPRTEYRHVLLLVGVLKTAFEFNDAYCANVAGCFDTASVQGTWSISAGPELAERQKLGLWTRTWTWTW